MHTDGMKIQSKNPEFKTIKVFMRITPTMNEQLLELAKKVGGDAGVATIMREIVEAALAEGIDVTGGAKHRVKANGKNADDRT